MQNMFANQEFLKNHQVKDMGITQWVYSFPNGMGASVVTGCGTYRADNKPYELAVLEFIDEDDFILNYNTEITHDVLGYQTKEQIIDILEKIKTLSKKDIFKTNYMEAFRKFKGE